MKSDIFLQKRLDKSANHLPIFRNNNSPPGAARDEVVMAGLRPGHPRLSCLDGNKGVDARVKPGHDEVLYWCFPPTEFPPHEPPPRSIRSRARGGAGDGRG